MSASTFTETPSPSPSACPLAISPHLSLRRCRVRTREVVMVVIIGVYLFGIGMLAGITMDRMRFDHQRSQVLHRYEQALEEWLAYRMALEKRMGDQP
jgi:hypothetical protein